jgi:NADH dehydrogenase
MFNPDFSGKVVTIFGGTGFLGRYIVAELVKMGFIIKIVTRHTQSAYFLRPYGEVGQIVPVYSAYSSLEEIEKIISGSYAVINCLGILSESGKRSTFSRVHTDLPKWMAKACAKTGVAHFVHISALGVDKSQSNYAATKILGERAVREFFPSTTILRPSVIFGAEDNFFNMFARLAKFLPILPLIGGGKTRFQPVYVLDVARAVVHALCNIQTSGQTYELGGPEVLGFKEIYERLFSYTGQKRCLISLPWSIARVQAFMMRILPNPPLTSDQITSLQTDNIVSDGALGLKDLNITATPMDTIVPNYLNYPTAHKE